MARGHGILVNLSSWAPFIFTYNPESVTSEKKINYAVVPNIGGASKKRYFSGFDSKEVSFHLTCVDMEGPTGVNEEVAYFEQLREPDFGLLGGWNLSYGNTNYPPPKVLFQFGISYLPLVWDVLDVKITVDHFYAGAISGVIGVPKKCEIDISLALDEEHVLNQANQIAKKAEVYAASIESIARETMHKRYGTRKELPGIFGLGGKIKVGASHDPVKNNPWW
jgi:hypothetical protein